MRGVKGVECQGLTEEFNKALGEVYESKPTQEMFEQEIEVSVEAEATVSESWTGSSTVRTQLKRARSLPRRRGVPPSHDFCAAIFLRAQWGNSGGDEGGGGSW